MFWAKYSFFLGLAPLGKIKDTGFGSYKAMKSSQVGALRRGCSRIVEVSDDTMYRKYTSPGRNPWCGGGYETILFPRILLEWFC